MMYITRFYRTSCIGGTVRRWLGEEIVRANGNFYRFEVEPEVIDDDLRLELRALAYMDLVEGQKKDPDANIFSKRYKINS